MHRARGNLVGPYMQICGDLAHKISTHSSLYSIISNLAVVIKLAS
jgi:hypothetical protein